MTAPPAPSVPLSPAARREFRTIPVPWLADVYDQPLPEPHVEYPISDGKPMADSDYQWRWVVAIVTGLQAVFDGREDIYIGGDTFWYPVRGNNRVVTAPDAMVAFGRPAGDRGSYKQWEEGDVAPQVVFEVLSHSNTPAEMTEKLGFYERYGVQEYYVIGCQGTPRLVEGYLRRTPGGSLEQLADAELVDWVSPRLGVRFHPDADRDGALVVFRPDGAPFESPLELYRRAQAEKARADALAARLRALGVDPGAERP